MQKIEITEELRNKLFELTDKGLTDVEIGLILGFGRKAIGKLRKRLGIKSFNAISDEEVEQVRNLAKDGYISSEIHRKTGISKSRIRKISIDYCIKIDTFIKITPDKEKRFLELYESGKMDSEIAKELNVSVASIFAYRKKHGLKTKFTYQKVSKIDEQKLIEMCSKELSDYVIAKEFGVKPCSVFSHRKYHGYKKRDIRFNKPISLTDFQEQVLIGTLLGDSSLCLSGTSNSNPKVSCSHCVAQKEYCEHKTSIFESIGAKIKYNKRNIADKRNGKLYEDYTMSIPCNPELKKYYLSFYKDGKKVIPFDLLDKFTEVSLAFMYMDDGYKREETYSISTNCFSKEELIKFKEFLFIRFGIETTVHKSNVMYIRRCSAEKFKSLIQPYIIPCMQYKLHK